MSQVLEAFACAGDLSMGQPLGHSYRTAVLGLRIARAIRADAETVEAVWVLALLRWSGCTANAHQFAQLLGDDVLGRAALVSGRNPFVEGVTRWDLLQAQGTELANEHCDTLRTIVLRLGLPALVADATAGLFSNWDGSGVPVGEIGKTASLTAQIASLAGDIEVYGRHSDALEAMLEHTRGTRHAPALIDAFRKLTDERPPPPSLALTSDAVQVASLLGDYADLKVPERRGQSRQRAKVAAKLGLAAGLREEERTALTQAAGMMHLGQVGVSNRILISEETSTDPALEMVPIWTKRILDKIPAFVPAARIAGQAQERFDGKGHPMGRVGLEISWPGRLLAASAIVASNAGPKAVAALREGVADGALCPQAAKLAAAVLQTDEPPISNQNLTLTKRQSDVLIKLSRGMTNKEIARDLEIAPRTVATHVETIFARLAVNSRASAAVRAMELGLLNSPL